MKLVICRSLPVSSAEAHCEFPHCAQTHGDVRASRGAFPPRILHKHRSAGHDNPRERCAGRGAASVLSQSRSSAEIRGGVQPARGACFSRFDRCAVLAPTHSRASRPCENPTRASSDMFCARRIRESVAPCGTTLSDRSLSDDPPDTSGIRVGTHQLEGCRVTGSGKLGKRTRVLGNRGLHHETLVAGSLAEQ